MTTKRRAAMANHPSNHPTPIQISIDDATRRNHNETTVDYGTTDNTNDPNRQDAAWHICGHDAHNWAATVYRGNELIDVYAEGEMEICLYDGNATVRDTAGLEDNGITTDKQLVELCEGGALTWVNNPWFDLYDSENKQIESVHFTLADAVAAATQILNETDQ